MNLPTWSCFAGIGGLELGLEMAGLDLELVLQCEFDPWNRALLAERFPTAVQHDDIRTLEPHHAPRPKLLCAGFPCQDLSTAGARAGLKGEKSGLFWPLVILIAKLRPEWVVFENVSAILSDRQPVVPPRSEWLGDPPSQPLHGALGAVLWALAACGYDALWDSVPAGALGAPHRRDRWFLVAHASGLGPQHRERSEQAGPNVAGLDPRSLWGQAIDAGRRKAPWSYLGGVGGAADGLPRGLDEAGAAPVGAGSTPASWPTPRATEHNRGGYQRGSNGEVWPTLTGATGAGHVPKPVAHRPWQPWEGAEPRVKPHGLHWTPRLKGLGNAVVPVVGMVPGLVLRQWAAALGQTL